MSASGIISQNNGKIFDEFLPNPYPYPAQAPPLAQVLIAGQNAGNQDITNLNQLETTNIVQQAPIGGHLSIGGAGGDLRIQGATTIGSLLVGDGTSTVELPVGANGLVLKANSAQPLGVEWGTDASGGTVMAVNAGTNINVSGTIAQPIVNFATPTTSNIEIGAGTEIVAKDNYATPTYFLSIDSTGFNDKYEVGSVINQEDFAVSATNVVQTLSATNTSDYINSATLTCDTNFISDTRSSQIITSGSEKTALVSISCDTSSSQPVASFSCGVSVPLPPADITANVGMGCSSTTNPNISISQSAPFAISYSTIIDKDGINSNNSGGVAGFTINSNTQPLALTTSDTITLSANDIDCSTTNLTLQTNTTGGGSNPLLTLNQQDTNVGAGSMRFYKNISTNGSAIGELSFVAKTAISGNPDREYARIDARIRNNNTSNVDGSIDFSARVDDVLTPIVRINGVDNQTEFFKPIDMNANAINTSAGDMTLDASTSVGAGNIVLTAKTGATLKITATTATAVQNHTSSLATTNNIGDITTYLKVQIGGVDAWVPYFTQDPTLP